MESATRDSVGFCRLQICNIVFLVSAPILTTFVSVDFTKPRGCRLLASGLLSNWQLTRLASRGGRNRSSTRLPVLGRQLRKGGLHQPPFLFPKPVFPFQPVVPQALTVELQP